MEISKIASDLRLTFPIGWVERPVTRRDDESDAQWATREGQIELVPTIWAYHTPISREVFEANWRIISATFSTLIKNSVKSSIIAVATLALKDAGRQDAYEYGLPEGLSLADGGTAAALCREIKRLTVVLTPGPVQYEMLPVEIAVDRGIIDNDQWAEAEASLVFFTCSFSLALRQMKLASATSLASALSGSITSLSALEFASSLNASMPKKTFNPAPMGSPSLVPS